MSATIVEKSSQDEPFKIRYYQLHNNGVGIVIWPQLRAASNPDGKIIWDARKESNMGIGPGQTITIDLNKFLHDTSTPFVLSENTMMGVDFYDRSKEFLFDPNSNLMAVATRNGYSQSGELASQGNKPGPSSIAETKASNELTRSDKQDLADLLYKSALLSSGFELSRSDCLVGEVSSDSGKDERANCNVSWARTAAGQVSHGSGRPRIFPKTSFRLSFNSIDHRIASDYNRMAQKPQFSFTIVFRLTRKQPDQQLNTGILSKPTYSSPFTTYQKTETTVEEMSLFRTWSASIRLPVVVSSGTVRSNIVDPDADYLSNESKREEDFQQCMTEQQAEFAIEEARQWGPEEARGKEFEEFLSQTTRDAQDNEKKRRREFEAAHKSQDAVFAKHESSREKRFAESRKKYVRAFEETQKEREKDAEWHQGIREATMRSTRSAQLEIVKELKQALEKQLGEIMVEQEKMFVAQEERRELATKKVLNKRRASAAVAPLQTMLPTPLEYEDLRRGRKPSDQDPRSARARSYSPVQYRLPSGYRPLTPPMEPPRVMVVPERRTISRSSSSSDPSIDSLPDERFQSEEPPPTSMIQTNSSREQFINAQESRMRRFQRAEESRDKKFFKAEDSRNELEAVRWTRFKGVYGVFKNTFQEHERAFRDAFTAAEDIRNQTELNRDEEFQAECATMEGKVEVFMTKLRKQVEIRTEVEKRQDETLKAPINRLLEKQNRALEEARVQKQARFEKAQTHREGLTNREVCPTIDSEHSSVSYISKRRTPPPRDPGLHAAQPSLRRTRSPSYRSRSRSRSPRRIVQMPSRMDSLESRARSPVAGFDPRALFVRNDLPSLPIPDDHNDGSLIRGLSADAERRRQWLYAKARAHRATLFTVGMSRRRSIFASAEAKRHTRYQRGQQKRKAKFEGNSRGWEEAFQRAQNERARTFLISERSRAAKFGQKEMARAKMFKDEQLKREAEYHEVQTQLTNSCFSEGDRRMEALQKWADSTLERQRQDEERACRKEENLREVRFQKWLALQDDSS